jgi:hypothetical protein
MSKTGHIKFTKTTLILEYRIDFKIITKIGMRYEITLMFYNV